MTPRLLGATGLFLLLSAGSGWAVSDPEEERLLRHARGVTAQAGTPNSGPVFAGSGMWSRAEVAFLLGSQRVREHLGFSRNIFGTVSAESENVGFGEHYGGRATIFVNRWFGLEGSWFRTTTEFEFSVADSEVGSIVFDDTLTQESDEFAGALIVQWPLMALTPYAAVGFGSRSAEVGMSDPFTSGSVHLGAGIKVPFGELPFSMTFDYRYVHYREINEAIRLVEGGTANPTASVLTVGIMLRTPDRH